MSGSFYQINNLYKSNSKIDFPIIILVQAWATSGLRATSDPPSTLIRPANIFVSSIKRYLVDKTLKMPLFEN